MRDVKRGFTPNREPTAEKKAGRLARLLVPDERVTKPEPWCGTPGRILHPEKSRPDDWCGTPLVGKRDSRKTK